MVISWLKQRLTNNSNTEACCDKLADLLGRDVFNLEAETDSICSIATSFHKINPNLAACCAF